MPEADERAFVARAARIAASGDLNPGWFGHPGSTVIYPLAAAYYICNGLSNPGPLVLSDPGQQAKFDPVPSEFFLIGRLLTVLYEILSLPLIYLIGRRLFNERVGLMASWLSLLSPIVVDHAKTARSDSAAVFFGALAFWLCLRIYDRPSKRNQVAAGIAIGMAIATRYFMVALIPVLIVVSGLVFWQKISRREKSNSVLIGAVAGLLAIAITFAATTPYFLLDFTTALHDLKFEAQDTQIGTTGLSRAGNFLWYLTSAIPMSLFWPQAVLGAVGIALIVRKRQPMRLLLLGLIAFFLVEISFSIQHVQRWVIPILPFFSILAAYGMNEVVDALSSRFRLSPRARQALFASLLVLLSAWPVYQLALLDIRQSRPSTMVLARQWIIENLPPDSHLALDRYTAPMGGTDFVVSNHRWLARNRALDDYYREGYRYLVVSSAMYDGYFAEPDRFRSEASFYSRLFEQGRLLQQFEPSATRDGPVIRIYELEGP